MGPFIHLWLRSSLFLRCLFGYAAANGAGGKEGKHSRVSVGYGVRQI